MRRSLPALLLAGLVAASIPMFAKDAPAQGNGSAAPAPPPAPAPSAPTATALGPAQAQTVLGKVQAFYDKTTSFSSDFTQEFFVKSHNIKKQSKGKVTFVKPGKMYWEYAEPKDNRVVSDGSVLKVYEAANKQMFEQNVDKSQYPAALSFLVGGGKLADTFDFELFEGSAMNFQGGQVLVGTPKTPSPAYQKVLFYIDGATWQARRVLIVDGQGNRNRFDFDNPKVNETIPPERFKFVPPQGTQVIRP